MSKTLTLQFGTGKSQSCCWMQGIGYQSRANSSLRLPYY